MIERYYPLSSFYCIIVITLCRYYSFVPAAPCSYLLPVSVAPAVPLAIPFFLAISFASSGLAASCPGSTIFSVISLFTAVGSCSFIFAGVIGSFSLYSFSESSFLPTSVPGAPSSNSVSSMPEEEETFSLVLATLPLVSTAISLALPLALSLVPITFSLIFFVIPIVVCICIIPQGIKRSILSVYR